MENSNYLQIFLSIVRIFLEDAPKVLDYVDELPHQVGLGPELGGGGHLDYQHQQSVGPHDDEEHLERLLQGEEGVEGVGRWGSRGQVRVGVAPPVQLTPPHALVQSTQLDSVVWIFVTISTPTEFLTVNCMLTHIKSIPYQEWYLLRPPVVEDIVKS